MTDPMPNEPTAEQIAAADAVFKRRCYHAWEKLDDTEGKTLIREILTAAMQASAPAMDDDVCPNCGVWGGCHAADCPLHIPAEALPEVEQMVEQLKDTHCAERSPCFALYNDEAAALLTSLSAKVRAYEAGLNSIANSACCDRCNEAKMVARATLSREGD